MTRRPFDSSFLISTQILLYSPVIIDQDQDYIKGQRVVGKSMNLTLEYQIKIFRYDLN